MRTTLTLDEDVAQRIKQLVRERGGSFKATVNELLRRGLAAQPANHEYETPTFEADITPGLDLTKALSLAAAFEDDAALDKLEHGK